MEEIEAATQACRHCGETKPIGEFDIRANTGKTKTECKDCRRKYQRERLRRLHPRVAKAPRSVGAATSFTCTRCGATKPAADFPPRRRGAAQLQAWCRACFAELNAERYARMRESELARLSRRRIAIQSANQQLLLAYLREHPCVDCGEADVVLLEFDHLRDKRYNVSYLLNSGATWQVIAREIANCEVCCANCHRIRTGQRSVVDTATIQLDMTTLWHFPLIVGPIESGTQVCNRCGIERPLSDFAFRDSKARSRHKICRECHARDHRIRYLRAREEQIARARRTRRRARRERDEVRLRMWQYLLVHPCVDCGNTDIRILDFDHLHDKRSEVGRLVQRGASWKRVLAEIGKCEVRCANCHRRRTAFVSGSYRLAV